MGCEARVLVKLWIVLLSAIFRMVHVGGAFVAGGEKTSTSHRQQVRCDRSATKALSKVVGSRRERVMWEFSSPNAEYPSLGELGGPFAPEFGGKISREDALMEVRWIACPAKASLICKVNILVRRGMPDLSEALI